MQMRGLFRYTDTAAAVIATLAPILTKPLYRSISKNVTLHVTTAPFAVEGLNSPLKTL